MSAPDISNKPPGGGDPIVPTSKSIQQAQRFDISDKQSDPTPLAVEIAAATFRVAALVRHPRLRLELEEAAIILVKFLDEESAVRLERLVGLAEAIEEINEINADVLLRELDNFLDLLGQAFGQNLFVSGQDRRVSGQDGQDGQLLRRKWRRWGRTEERQAAVLDFIRGFPEPCPVQSIFLEFAFVSPRTLRRDIEELAGRGSLKRNGQYLILHESRVPLDD